MRLSQRVKKNMLKNKQGEYAISAEGNNEQDIQLKSRDQEIAFDTGNDRDETEETRNIDDMTIDVGERRGT